MAKEVKKAAEQIEQAEEAKDAQKAEKKKEKKSQKERPRSKKKHTKIKIWKLYSLKDGKLSRKNAVCPRCGPGTFLATFQNRKYCGKCHYGLIQEKV